jgi:hypothetical protein
MGKMKIPATTSTSIAAMGDRHVAVAAERNHTALETIWPANPPWKTVRTSRCASVMVTMLMLAQIPTEAAGLASLGENAAFPPGRMTPISASDPAPNAEVTLDTADRNVCATMAGWTATDGNY